MSRDNVQAIVGEPDLVRPIYAGWEDSDRHSAAWRRLAVLDRNAGTV